VSGADAASAAKGAERVIFALDMGTGEEALGWVDRLGLAVGMYKVGLELFVATGPKLVEEIVARGSRVFLDLKFHDIPNTVAGAVRSVAGLGASIVNVHALAGSDAMKRAAETIKEDADKRGVAPPKLIAVTVLTSHGPETLSELGLAGPSSEAVERLALLARGAGLDGVVCSPLEAAMIRNVWDDALIVTPGVRPADAEVGDQVRVATPAGAIRAGADYLVVGRPIRAAADPAGAARAIADEVAGVL